MLVLKDDQYGYYQTKQIRACFKCVINTPQVYINTLSVSD